MAASVLLTEHETSDLECKVVAYIEENGQIVLRGYDSDGNRDWGVTVEKEQKDGLLLSLIKESFRSDLTPRTFSAWLEQNNIRYKLDETSDMEPSGP